MEDNLRNVLIILSAIAITAIFIHGLWTIRKQKNPYKLTASKDKVEPIKRDFDGKGFDQDGVGQVKIKKNSQQSEQDNFTSSQSIPSNLSDNDSTNTLSDSQIIVKQDMREKENFEPRMNEETGDNILKALDDSIENDWFGDEGKAEKNQDNNEIVADTINTNQHETTNTERNQADSLLSKMENATKESQPLYEEPVTQAKPQHALPTKNQHKKNSVAALKKNQLEIDFTSQQYNETDVNNAKHTVNDDRQITDKPPIEIDPQVIILSVVMPANQQMFGAALLPTLLTLGLKYGEMNIFHRHQDNAGQGKVTFSLANIMNPGSFDLDTIETFATRGVSLFMTLPNAGDPLNVFEQMLNAAKQLAQEFNAQVLDDKRNILTKQTEQHYVNTIREFDRISRISPVR